MKGSQFYHLLMGLLRNKDIYEKCKLDILKIYFKRIQAMKMKFLRAILNKRKKDRIRNTNIRLELGVDEIKNDI